MITGRVLRLNDSVAIGAENTSGAGAGTTDRSDHIETAAEREK